MSFVALYRKLENEINNIKSGSVTSALVQATKLILERGGKSIIFKQLSVQQKAIRPLTMNLRIMMYANVANVCSITPPGC